MLSVSAVGEQYVDLQPRTESGPYLHDGSVIAVRDTTIPQPVGPMLDQVSALVDSIPKDKLSALLDETFKGFNGAGYDLGSLLDSSAEVIRRPERRRRSDAGLIDDSAPLLDSQAQTTDAIRTWARSLAGVTEQLVTDDPQVRTLLRDRARRRRRGISAARPGQTDAAGAAGQPHHARPGRRDLPRVAGAAAGAAAAVRGRHAVLRRCRRTTPTVCRLGDFTLKISDPPACTVGFLPPSQWRSPADTTDIDTPDGLYCKLPQDSPIGVRGARNYPCMGQPGKRAPTVEICDSDQPYRAVGDAPARARPLPDRSEPDRAGHPAR